MADEGTGQQLAGWRKDPSGRHFGRYWDGRQWTEHVISAEKVQSIDPVPRPPEPPTLFPDSPPAPAAPTAPVRPTVSYRRGPAVTTPGWRPASAGDSADPHGRRQAATIALVGAGAIAVGCFLPWAKLTAPFIGTVTKSGMEGGDGIFFLALAAGIAAVGGRLLSSAPAEPGRYRLGLAVLTLAVLIMGVIEVADMRSKFADATAETDLISASYGGGIWLIGLGGVATAVAWFRMPWGAD